ncbi:MAG: CRISPR-associated endoribonuclease Cas6 [Candidatus Woesearchaeota archaeon]
MRILLNLKSLKTIPQKEGLSKFNSAMHGWIYKKLDNNSKYKELHNQKVFKPFCFGNIFPIKNAIIELNNKYNMTISSPEPELIRTLFFSLEQGEIINLGEMQFELIDFLVKPIKLHHLCTIESATIISLTKHENGKIKSLLFNDVGYLKQLKVNLIKKYNQLTNKDVSLDFDLFNNINITAISRKYALPILMDENNSKRQFIAFGERLKIEIGKVSEEQLGILQIGFDAGFGERNSYGLGFMVNNYNGGKK